MEALRPVHATRAQLDAVLDDNSWIVEPKHNGIRALWEDGRFLNRYGVPLSKPVDADIVAWARTLPDGVRLDGELVGGRVYHLFDAPAAGTLAERLPLVTRLCALADAAGVNVVPVESIVAPKLYHMNRWAAAGVEGYVFKNLLSTYPLAGGETRQWLKWKLVKSIDVVVMSRGVDKENWVVGLYKPGATEPTEVGKVSALTGSADRIRVGDVVEVTVLEVTDNDRLREPVSPVIRTDKTPEQCLWAQLDDLRKGAS